MERKYSHQLLADMNKKATTIDANGLKIIVKPIPDVDEPGVMDPRLKATMKHLFRGIGGFLTKRLLKSIFNPNGDMLKSVQRYRSMSMPGSIPVSENVDVRTDTVTYDEVKVPIRIYTAKNKTAELKPVLYYIHGGGFIGGTLEINEQLCRTMVEKTGCIAVQVGYRLGPEHPFPAGMNDCYEVLKWIYSNAESLGGDRRKICVAGDSAGGNLAAVCSLRNKDEGAHMVMAQALIYPVTDNANVNHNVTEGRKQYEIAASGSKDVNAFADAMGMMLTGYTMSQYMGVKDDTVPYFSPIYGDLCGVAPALMCQGEFELFRIDNEAYARKLLQAGVEVKFIRYRGCFHAFLDQVGVLPQAEDIIDEIAAHMMREAAKV